jgi:hypothetical protein
VGENEERVGVDEKWEDVVVMDGNRRWWWVVDGCTCCCWWRWLSLGEQ